MTTSVSITQEDVFSILRAFVLSIISCEVVQGLGNGTPMPLNPFIAMTPSFLNRLSTNVVTYNGTDSKMAKQAIEFTVQIDCYGPQSLDWAVILTTMLRDDYGALNMAPNVAPLSADDPKQIPLVDGEECYEQRWVISALLQYNPVVTVSQDFMGAVNIVPVNVDATYPP